MSHDITGFVDHHGHHKMRDLGKAPFVKSGTHPKFRYLKVSLALVLLVVGVKMFLVITDSVDPVPHCSWSPKRQWSDMQTVHHAAGGD